MKKLCYLLLFILSFSYHSRAQNQTLHWQQVNSVPSLIGNDAVWSFTISGNNIFAAASYGGVYKSTDNGNNWTSSGLLYDYVVSLAVHDGNIFAGTIDSGIFLSTDMGNSWQAVNNGFPTDTFNYVNSIVVSGNNIFAGNVGDGPGTGAGVFLSSNNGSSWTNVSNGLADSSIWVLATKGDSIFAGGGNGGIFLSNNNGSSWTALNTEVIGIRSFAISGDNIFAATVDSGIYLSKDGGQTWTAVNKGIPYSLLYGYKYIYSLAIKGNNIFAAIDTGIVVSTNNGNYWTLMNNGLPQGVVPISLFIKGNYIFAGLGNIWMANDSLLSSLSLTFSGTDTIGCNNVNGRINVNVNAGYPPYSYQWSTGASTQDLSGLAGSASGITYSVTVTDDSSNSTTGSFTIVQSTGLNLTLTTGSDSIGLTVSGGKSPYAFYWSNSKTTRDITGLANGEYSVTITDANGCSAIDSATVGSGCTRPTISLNPLSATINNGDSVSLTASGATTYNWSPSTGLNYTIGSTVIARPSITTTYMVTGTTGICSGIQTVIVTVTGSGNQISGTVSDDSVNFNSGTIDLAQLNSSLLTIQLYRNSNLISTTSANTSGYYQFTNLSNGAYDLLFTYDDGTGNPVSLKEKSIQSGNSVDVQLPYTLIKQVVAFRNELQQKEIPYQYFNGLINFDVPCNGYDESSVTSLAIGWHNTVNNNAGYINALSRLLIAQDALNEFSADGSLMVSESMITCVDLGDVVISLVDMSNALNDLLNSNSFSVLLDPLVNDLTGEMQSLVIEGIGNTLSAAVNLIPDATIRSNYQSNIQGIFDKLQVQASQINVGDFSQSLVDQIVHETILNFGTAAVYASVYIPVTQGNVETSVINAQTFNYSGSFNPAFQQVASLTGNSDVANSHSITNNIRNSIETLRTYSGVAGVATDVLAAATALSTATGVLAGIDVITGPLATIAGLVNAGINADALGKSAGRIYDIKGELNNATNQSYLRKEQTGQPYSYSSVHKTRDALSGAISNYNTQLTSLVTDINARKRQNAITEIHQLLQLDTSLGNAMNESLIQIYGVMPYSSGYITHPDSLLYYKVIGKAGTSAFARVPLYDFLIGYLVDSTNQRYIDSINDYAGKIVIVNGLMENTIQSAQDSVSSISLPDFIKVTSCHIPSPLFLNQTYPVILTFKNYGTQDATGLYCKLNVNSGYSIINDSIYVGGLEVGNETSLTFNIKIPPYDTIGYFTAIFNSSVGESTGFGKAIYSSTLTSAKEILRTGNLNFNCYPNPNSGLFEVKLSGHFRNGEVNIFNSIGQLVYHKGLITGAKQLNISLADLPGGIYFVQVVSKEGVQTKKIVVAK